YTLPQGGSLLVPASSGVLANDTLGDGPGPLTAVLLVPPAHGALTLNADGSFTYSPDASFFGGDSFTYSAHDGGGGSSDAVVTLTVDPTPGGVGVITPGTGPVARPDTVAVDEDAGPTPVDVLANDSASEAGGTLTV